MKRIMTFCRRALHPRRGQSLVIFALSAFVVMGALGLVLDAGYDYTQRRTMQNVADAAALAGTRTIVINDKTLAPVYDAVKTTAMQNGLRDPDDSTTGATLTCRYIKNDYKTTGATYGPCKENIPGGDVSGVQVTVSEQHRTFVLSILGIGSSSTAATATAQVQVVTEIAKGQAPFIVCGIDTKVADGTTFSIYNTAASPNQYYPGTTFKATQEYGSWPTYPWINDPAANSGTRGPYYYDWFKKDGSGALIPINYAPQGNTPIYGPEYVIHGPQIAFCNVASSSWKGNNFSTDPIDLKASGYSGPADPSHSDWQNWSTLLIGSTGTVAGTAANLAGVGGCKNGVLNNCVMVLPVIDNSSTLCCAADNTGSNAKIAVRTFQAFWVTQQGSNEHHGFLIKNYPLSGKSAPIWSSSYTGPINVRLIK